MRAMRVWWLMLVAGCGFQISSSGGQPGGDAAIDAGGPGTEADASEPMDAADALQCPANYITLGSLPSRYFLNTLARTMVQHHDLCAQDGTHLAVVDSADEAQPLKKIVDDALNLPSTGYGPQVYIGSLQARGRSSPATGWISATGPFDGSYWHVGEPNDGAGLENDEEQAAFIWRGHDLLSDYPHTVNQAAICECDGLSTTAEYEALVADLAGSAL